MTWVKEFAETFDPKNNKVVTKNGTELTYDYLTIAS